MLREALTPEFSTPEAKAVWAMRLWLVVLAGAALVVEPQYTTRPMLVSTALWGLAASLLFAFIPTRRPRTLKRAELGLLVAFALHMMGHTFGWYHQFAWYDSALHFSMPLVSVLILYALSQSARWIWDWRTIRPFPVGVHLFAMAVALGALWEILEFGSDQFLGTKEQDGLYDTMIDLVLDTAGALLGAIGAALATAYGLRHGQHTVSEEPKRPYPMRAPKGASRE